MREDYKIPSFRLSKFYFVYFASLGIFLPYWAIYLKSLGFNIAEIGQLIAMIPATKIIAPLLWGWIADKSGKRIGVVRTTSLLAVVVFAAIDQVRDYWSMVAVTLAFSFFWNASLPLFEAVTLSFLEKKPHRYSLIRLWGSIGFIVTVVGTGVALDYYSPVILPRFALGCLLLLWLISLILPEPTITVQPKIKGQLRRILRQRSIIALMFVFLLIQLSHGPYYALFSLFLEQKGYSSTATGLLWATGVVAEIVLFLFMPYLLSRYTLRKIILASILFSILRWMLIAQYANQPIVLYFAQVLHAASFGSAHVAAVHMVHRHFGVNFQAIGQALYASVSFGLGGMLGSFYSGWFWQQFGAEQLFMGASVACVLAYIIAWLWIAEQPLMEHADLVVIEEEL
jgi:PPP family 3-phenylpropionic acid transporter